MNIKIHDIVRFIDDVGGGRVTRIAGKTIYVEGDDGFERPALERDLVVVGHEADTAARADRYDRPMTLRGVLKPAEPEPAPEPEPLPPPEETPEGELLNVVLTFEPREPKRLNTTTFYVTLINASNYYLQAAVLTRGDDTALWTTRWHGMVEPNTQEDVGEVSHADLPEMTHVAVQYIAFKQGKAARLKNPTLVEKSLNTSQFVKLHCFMEHPYSDAPVIALDITRDDRPQLRRLLDSESGELQAVETSGVHIDDREPAPRGHRKRQRAGHRTEPVVVDLHIHELLDTTAGMTNADILNYQLDKFNETMREHLQHAGQRLVFIHGKGEGVLRRAILEEVRRHYNYCEVQDASFQEYGFGATQITIHQKKS